MLAIAPKMLLLNAKIISSTVPADSTDALGASFISLFFN